MKILYAITKSNFGGAQRYVFDLATHFSKEHEVIVVFGGHGLLEKKLQAENIRTISLESLGRDISIFKDIAILFELFKIFKKERPDIIHLNSSKVGLLGSLAAIIFKLSTKHYRLKTIFTAHGWPFNETHRNFLSKLFIWKLSWLTALLSTDVIVIAQKELVQAQKFPLVRKNKIYLIRNGIDTINFLEKSEARKHLGVPENATVVGTIAELHKNKGLDTLIWACATLPALHLVIIGDGEEKERLKKIASASEIRHIYFAGFKENAPELLPAFDVFVLPSRKEGLPYTILEAGLAKLPVAASSVGGVPEIILQKKTGLLVEPGNAENLQAALISLLENAELRKILGENLYHHIEEAFSQKEMLEKTQSLYLK